VEIEAHDASSTFGQLIGVAPGEHFLDLTRDSEASEQIFSADQFFFGGKSFGGQALCNGRDSFPLGSVEEEREVRDY
jgi:hypothetical protein